MAPIQEIALSQAEAQKRHKRKGRKGEKLTWINCSWCGSKFSVDNVGTKLCDDWCRAESQKDSIARKQLKARHLAKVKRIRKARRARGVKW